MFQLLNLMTGAVYETEQPRFVRKIGGVWLQCNSIDAECIAINGERFSISGRALVDDAPQVLAVSKINPLQKISALNSDNDDIKSAILDIQDAVLDIYLNGLKGE